MILRFFLIFLLSANLNVAFVPSDIFLGEVGKDVERPYKIGLDNIGVEMNSKKFIAVDVGSGQVLFAKDPSAAQPIASITKLMTAIVVLERNPNWQSAVEMIKEDETFGAAPHIYRGERVTFYDLWNAALISSDNNAIMAMVRILGLGEKEFVGLMNDKARELGLVDTKFSDPTGLDSGNISSAADIARLLHYALAQNGIREMVLRPQYELKILNKNKPRKIFNTDILLSSFLNKPAYGYELIGGKTGYTTEAGYCLAVELAKGGRRIIIVVLDGASIDDRFNDVKVLADWVFSNYKW